jgi:hypothetical protein
VSPPISEIFYPTPELKAMFGERLTYIEAVLSSQVLDACGVTHRLDAKACLKRLRHLKAEGGDTTPQLHVLYRHLEQFWDKEGAIIKQAFSLEGLIRIKGTRPLWAKPTEVAWRSNSPFLDSLYPPLQGQYRDFSVFFNERLGIPKELPTGKWVEALSELDQIGSIDERRREALAIYRRANRDLTPRFGRDEVPTPGWLSAFEADDVFLNHRDELVSNDEQLFANDAPELAALFADEADISFLAVSPEEVPRLERLLNATGVPRLSTSVIVELIEASGGRVESALTGRVRRSIPYLGRVLYAKSHERFESAVEHGLFRILRDLDVVEVPELKLSVTLAETARTTAADTAQSEGKIFIRAKARSIKDQLATELCRLLEAPLDLADTFARILMEEDADGVEDFLRVRRIGQLPADLLGALTEGKAQQPFEEQSSGSGEEEAADPDLEEPDAKPSATDVEPPAAESLPAPDDSRGSAAADSGGWPASDGTTGMTGYRRQANPAGSPPPDGASATAGYGSGLSPPHPSPQTYKGAPASQPSEQVAPEGRQQAGGSMGATEVERQVEDLPSSGAARASQHWKAGASVGPSRGSITKRGRGSRQRTKAGRLMSYTAAPGDTGETDDEDPAKAAAREALGKEAVEYFLATQASRWMSLIPMPHNNPGFDVKAVAHDGADEFIEVKGQSAAWTEAGVALTPKELETAQKYGDRYWMCVVEHLQDENRRFLYLVQNPYGLTQQFRFDSGWKTAATGQAAVPLKPAVGLRIDMPAIGRGRILSVKKSNQFYKVHVLLDGGRQTNRLFNPATMKLSAE